MQHLDALESESIYIIREAVHAIPKLAMLWSFGKDSNVLIHLVRKAFLGYMPFPALHCDTALEMPEVYAFRDHYTKEWELEFLSEICPPLQATDANLPNAARVAARKTLGLEHAIKKHGFTGIMSGIRRDEEPTRAKERIFSPRGEHGEWNVKEQPTELWGQYKTKFAPGTHVRVHPLLHWSELDIWRYIKREEIPVVPLYFAKPYREFEGREFNGEMMRFRSIGERGITWPTLSMAENIDEIIKELENTLTSERAGRPMGADEDEGSFERLRAAGYM